MKEAAGILLISPQDTILLLQRSPETSSPLMWDIPGGGLEDDEDPYEAIERELKEETWISLDDVQLYPSGVFEYTGENGEPYLWYNAIGLVDEELPVRLDWEHVDHGWFGVREIEELELHPGVVDLLMVLGIM